MVIATPALAWWDITVQIEGRELVYPKNPKNSATGKICCNHSKLGKRLFYHRVRHPTDADGMANSVDTVWSGSALFANTCLSENLGSLWYLLSCVFILYVVLWVCFSSRCHLWLWHFLYFSSAGFSIHLSTLAVWFFTIYSQTIRATVFLQAGRGSSIVSMSAWHASGPEFDPHIRHILSWRLGHEKNSTAILPLPLIQEE